MFLSGIFLFACFTQKENKKVKTEQQKQYVKHESENVKADYKNLHSTEINTPKLRKQPLFVENKKLDYTFGKVVDRSKTGGCTFVILVNDSVVFEPINLEDKFKSDSLEIIFKFRKSRAMTTCMMGQPIIISKIKASKQ